MSASRVFFTDMRASQKENLPAKLERLLGCLDLETVIPDRSLVAIKLHFGEKGNTAFIRPLLVRRVVDHIHSLGGRPFLTDANTLYSGTRGNSVSHLTTAVENGFAYSVVNAPLIIADGMRGASCAEVEINREIIGTAYIGREIVESDVLISLAHFKGHELTGFGGTIKNLGMGCASRRGKMAQHADLAPKIKAKKCIGCGECAAHCAQSAIFLEEGRARIHPERCVGCGECILICPNRAISVRWNADIPRFQKKMAEYTLAVLEGKGDRAAFVNVLTQISPACDCHGHNDAPIVQDLGFMASRDPVAIDQAPVDMVNAQAGLSHSCLVEGKMPGEDKFRSVYPQIDWTIQLEHAERLGLGSRTYEMITI
ncbi:MAG: DUF362 domain-containing protein [Deltaproteobacteria bacterium]|nr:DUF362 domain-containing protein [Deltaproteobacteria bacterium]